MAQWPAAAKPVLMDAVPWPVWQRILYPVWLRWYRAWGRLPIWREGLWRVGDTTCWRGVKLVCCLRHFAGERAEHPWDPGWGWAAEKAAALWEPARRRDRVLLALIGDPRRPAASQQPATEEDE